MTDRDKIDNCKNIFLTKLCEPRQNELLIEITLGSVSDIENDFFVGNKSFFGRQISFNQISDKYVIYFDSYISYFIINERYENGISGEYSGNKIREYRQSAFIDFCEKETCGFTLFDGHKIQHFAIVTQNHIVNVLTTSSIEIKLS